MKQSNSDGIGGDTEKSGAGVSMITPPRKERLRKRKTSSKTTDSEADSKKSETSGNGFISSDLR